MQVKTTDGRWVTINGRHVLIKEGESATEALNRSIAESNADLKKKQIAQNKAQSDKLNGKQTMKMSKDYYKKNVDMGVEFEEEDGHRYWEQCKGSEVEALIDKKTKDGRTYLSDVDFAVKQSDPKVRDFLNFVFYNAYNNPNFKGKGTDVVMDMAFDREFIIPTNPDKKNIHFK